MKTALDLPDELVREVKIRAATEGRKLKDVIAELLRRGLDSDANLASEPSSALVKDAVTGLPMVACHHSASMSDRLTPSKIAGILLDQEVAWTYDAGR